MKTQAKSIGSGGYGSPPHLAAWSIVLAALVFLAVAAVYAYCRIFSQFAFWDDEGFLMISVRRFLEGSPLYDSFHNYYGPFYYSYQWLVHTITFAPVSHDVTGILCLLHWLAAAAILAVAGGLLSRSALVGLFVFAQAVVHLGDLIREPGHPQELVVLLLALTALIAAMGLRSRWRLTLLGGIGAALAFTKINVGAFFALALLLALLCHASPLQSRRGWFWGLLAITALFPWLLTRPHWAEAWALLYSWQISATILAAGGVAFAFAAKRWMGPAQWSWIGIGYAGLSLILVGVLFSTVTSASALIENLVIGPSKLAYNFYVPFRVSYSSWSALAALLAAAVVIGWGSGSDRLRFSVTLLKGLYGLLGSMVLVADPKAQLGYLVPWLWLLLVPAEKDQGTDGCDNFPRALLCLVAAWQSLQVYPVAGTQMTIATFLLVLVYSICLHEALTALSLSTRILRDLAPWTALSLKSLALVGLSYLFVVRWCSPLAHWRTYFVRVPLALPGAHLLRLPDYEVQTYRSLVSYLRSDCDVFLTYPGLNSLYFWTGNFPPPSFELNGEGILSSERQQTQILAALQQAKHPLIVVNEQRLPDAMDAKSLATTPLGSFLRDDCHEVRRIDSFRFLEPKATALAFAPPH
jgi:hypothetical protein